MGNVDHITFDQCVKDSKAVAWLLKNDESVRYFVKNFQRGPIRAILCAIDCGKYLQRKVIEVSAKMEVTEEDRKHGHSVPLEFYSWSAFDRVEEENRQLREALRNARSFAINVANVTSRDFAAQIGITATQLSRWTDSTPNREPDFQD